MRSTTSLACLLGLASSAVIPFGNQRTDMYDDLGPATLPAPFQSDGGIIYNGFAFAANTQPTLAGIRTKSPPNSALYNAPDEPALLNPPSIATSQVCFQLQEFYFGCAAAAAQGTVTAPLPCTINLQGFNGDNQMVGSQSFTFTPQSAVVSDMGRFTVTKIPRTSLISFNTTVLGSGVLSAAAVTLFDNVKYTQFDDQFTCGRGF